MTPTPESRADLASAANDGVTLHEARQEVHDDRLSGAFRDAVLAGDGPRVRDLALRHDPAIDRLHARTSRRGKQLA